MQRGLRPPPADPDRAGHDLDPIREDQEHEATFRDRRAARGAHPADRHPARSCPGRLPEPGDRVRGAVRRRQRHRHARPGARREDVGKPRPSDRGRQQAGCQRLPRRAERGARRARRAHRARHLEHDPRRQPEPVQEAALRPDRRLRAGDHARHHHAGPRGQPVGARLDRQGADRLRQGQPGRAHLRQRLELVADRGRDAEDPGRHRHDQRALQEQPAGRHRPARRADLAGLRRHLDHAAAGQGRQGEGAGGVERSSARRSPPTCRPWPKRACRATT